MGFVDALWWSRSNPTHDTPVCGRCQGSGVEPGARELAARESYAEAREQHLLDRLHDGCFSHVVRDAVFEALDVGPDERAALAARDRLGDVGCAISEAIERWLRYALDEQGPLGALDETHEGDVSSVDGAPLTPRGVPADDIPF